MKILKPYNSKAIVNNVKLVFKTGDIKKLNNPTYHFIYLLSGFIAHYNLYGFQDTYSDLREFGKDLLNACSESEERRSTEKWAITEYGIGYCQSKADAIKGIREVVLKYQNEITKKAEEIDIEKLTNLRDIIDEVLSRNDPQLAQKLAHRLELR